LGLPPIIPRTQQFSCDICKRESRARICADDFEAPLQDVKGLSYRRDEWNTRIGFVALDLSRIEDGEGVALNVELGLRRVEFVDAARAVVGDAQEGAAEGVEIGSNRGRGSTPPIAAVNQIRAYGLEGLNRTRERTSSSFSRPRNVSSNRSSTPRASQTAACSIPTHSSGVASRSLPKESKMTHFL
jgi:hypothetical protein